jgi:hypothetical protein
MKIFDKNDGIWSDKVNFVDIYNVMLGYDTAQDCCEQAGWFISDGVQNSIVKGIDPESFKLVDYSFDRNFFKHVENRSCFDEGAMVVFRITHFNQEKFIHLYNCHNGYYGHGFDFKIGDNVIEGGCL